MKKNRLALLLGVTLIFIVGIVVQMTWPTVIKKEKLTQAPPFKLKKLDGAEISLNNELSKYPYVLVNFWATWCVECAKEIPELINLQRQYPQRLAIIGVNIDNDQDQKKIAAYVKEHRINYTIVVSNKLVPKAYSVVGVPVSFLIGSHQKVLAQYLGVITPMMLDEIRKQVAKNQ